MGSLIIIPAATARRLAWNFRAMLLISSAVALMATLCGTYLAAAFSRRTGTMQTGPFIVMVASMLFALSLVPSADWASDRFRRRPKLPEG